MMFYRVKNDGMNPIRRMIQNPKRVYPISNDIKSLDKY